MAHSSLGGNQQPYGPQQPFSGPQPDTPAVATLKRAVLLFWLLPTLYSVISFIANRLDLYIATDGVITTFGYVDFALSVLFSIAIMRIAIWLLLTKGWEANVAARVALVLSIAGSLFSIYATIDHYFITGVENYWWIRDPDGFGFDSYRPGPGQLHSKILRYSELAYMLLFYWSCRLSTSVKVVATVGRIWYCLSGYAYAFIVNLLYDTGQISRNNAYTITEVLFLAISIIFLALIWVLLYSRQTPAQYAPQQFPQPGYGPASQYGPDPQYDLEQQRPQPNDAPGAEADDDKTNILPGKNDGPAATPEI